MRVVPHGPLLGYQRQLHRPMAKLRRRGLGGGCDATPARATAKPRARPWDLSTACVSTRPADGLLVERLSRSVFDCDRAPRALAQAVAQPVAEVLTCQPGLPIDDPNRPLGTAWHAQTTAVTLVTVDLYNLSCCQSRHVARLPVQEENCHLLYELYAVRGTLSLTQINSTDSYFSFRISGTDT